MSVTLLHISDTHGGLMSGLLAPGTKLEYDNGELVEVLPTSTSLWLWDNLTHLINATNDFAGGEPVIVYHTGDVCHGSTYPDYLYSCHQDHQEQIAVQALSALRGIHNLRAVRLCYGTGAHDYGQQAATRGVASALAAWGVDVACVDHGYEEVAGAVVDWCHIGPKPARGADRAVAVRAYTIRSTRSYLERGKRAPDVLLRGHVHDPWLDLVCVHFGRIALPVTVSVAPPLTGVNEYARRFNHETPITIVGGHLFRVDNGRVVETLPVTFEREERQRVDGVLAHPYTGPVSVNKN